MSGSNERARPAIVMPVMSDRHADLARSGVVVELDAAEAERVGAFEEAALSEAEAWNANMDVDATDSETAPDDVQHIASAVIEQLQAGKAPWIREWQPGDRFLPYNPASGAVYHGVNAIWLMSRAESLGFGDTRWMTRLQAVEAGGHVREGEQATLIQFWKQQGLEHVRGDDGRPVLDEEDNPVWRMVQYERPRVWSAAVFNGEQIEGLGPAPAWPALPGGERHKKIEAILANSGAEIRHSAGGHAAYDVAADVITLPNFDRDQGGAPYFREVLHSLSHWTGHQSRLNRDLVQPIGSDGLAREELRASLSSLLLGEWLGIGHQPAPRAATHGRTWTRMFQEDPHEIFRAAADAEKTVGILRRLEPERARDEEPGPPIPASTAPAPASISANITETTPGSVQTRMPIFIPESHPSMAAMDDRTYLAVPYAEKDDAKALGAQWDRQAKAWFVPAGVALEAFQPWLPATGQVHIAVDTDPREEFARTLRESGLRVHGSPQMDGSPHRAPVVGDQEHERSGAYIGDLDGRPAGFIQNFRTGARVQWKASGPVAPLDAMDRARMAAEAAQRRHDRAAEREKQYERVAQEVDAIWTAATPVEVHPYLTEKGVPSHGLRSAEDGRLLVPVRDADGKIWSLQHIAANGAKQFHPEARMEGGHFVIGDIDQAGPLLIAEGYATAASVHDLTGQPTVVAFNAGNLASVAETYRRLFRERAIYIAGDNDHLRAADGKPNVGAEKAEQAADAIGGFALLPVFTDQDTGSDWNGLVHARGRDHARGQIQIGFAIAERELIVRSLSEAGQLERADSVTLTEAPKRERVSGSELER